MTESADTHAIEASPHASSSSADSLGVDFPGQFREEDLRRPVKGDPGYFPARLGQHLENGRYCIVRKLGWGHDSNVWLARDRTDKRFVSLKILNREATEDLENGKSDELGLLRTTAESNPSHRGFRYNLLYYDTFKLRSPHGEHQCIVTEVLGSCISRLREVGDGQKAQLEQPNTCHIVHTDIKFDNILFRLKPLDDLIARQLATDPSSICNYNTEMPPPEVPIIMSQPFPLTINIVKSEELELIEDPIHSMKLFSPLRFGPQRSFSAINGIHLLISGIWAALVAELLTGGCWLFEPDFLTRTWSYAEDHLACMTEVLQTNFDSDFLNKCENKRKYFKEDGTFAHFTEHETPSDTVKEFLAERSIIVDEAERDMAERFILRCLQLVPENRPTNCWKIHGSKSRDLKE